MSTYRGAKAKICRRLGINLYGSPKFDKIMEKKPFPPGKSLKARPSKPTEYAKQLMEKQKARFMYGLTEKQFSNTYKKAYKKQDPTGVTLMTMLETRLDNVIFRAGFATSRPQARQFVSHGVIKLNGRRVNIPSIQVKPGDVFEVREKLQSSPAFESVKANKSKVAVPTWLKINHQKLLGEVIETPKEDDIEKAIDHQLIVEFYSK